MAHTKIRLLGLAVLFAAIGGGASPAWGSFPGQNGTLAFDAVHADTSTVQIFTVSAGGTGLEQLTRTTGSIWNEDPAFSANGETIFFASMDRATDRPSHIYRMTANGTGRQLADQASAPTHVWPSVNRSGSRLAVVQYADDGRSVIATMKPNGENRRIMSSSTRLQSAGVPEYAPSGSRFAFYRVTYNENGQGIAKSDLFVRSGARITNITRSKSAKFYAPSWAPDGQMLLALRGQRTIVSMKTNGTGVRVLTTVSGAETSIGDAVYSPDGKKIAYLQCAGNCGDPNLEGQGSIWVMNADGSGKERIFNGGNGVQPANRISWGVR